MWQRDMTHPEFVDAASTTNPNVSKESVVRQYCSESINLINYRGMLIGVLPVAAVSWHRIQLPKARLSAPKLRAVIHGLLEDVLLDDPNSLHFVLEPDFKTGTPVWVAVCDKNWLDLNLKSLANEGHSPKRLIPEHFPHDWNGSLPEGSIWMRSSGAWISWGDQSGVHQFPLGESSSTHQVNKRTFSEMFSRIHVGVDVSLSGLDDYPNATRASLDQRVERILSTKWNLAQYEFSPKTKRIARILEIADSISYDVRWKSTRIALFFFVVSCAVGTNLVAWKENELLKHQDKLMIEMLHTSFPKITTVIDPLLQMKKEIENLRRAAGQVELEDAEFLLASFGATQVSKETGASNVSLDYDRKNGLVIRPLTLDGASFSMTRDAIRSRGIDMERTTDGLRLFAPGRK